MGLSIQKKMEFLRDVYKNSELNKFLYSIFLIYINNIQIVDL